MPSDVLLHLSYHTLIFDLISSRNMYLYNAHVYTNILFIKRGSRGTRAACLSGV